MSRATNTASTPNCGDDAERRPVSKVLGAAKRGVMLAVQAVFSRDTWFRQMQDLASACAYRPWIQTNQPGATVGAHRRFGQVPRRFKFLVVAVPPVMQS